MPGRKKTAGRWFAGKTRPEGRETNAGGQRSQLSTQIRLPTYSVARERERARHVPASLACGGGRRHAGKWDGSSAGPHVLARG